MLTDGLSPALAMMSHRLLGVHRSVAQINSGLGGWRTALIGAAGILGGTMILGGLAKVASHGKEILDQQDKLLRTTKDHNAVLKITADAYNTITKAVPTATAADVLRMTNELILVKGSWKDAAEASTQSLKLEAILGNATGKSAEGQGYNVWRALELKNATLDHGLTDKLMGSIVQSMIASGGKITGLDWQTLAMQGGVSWTNASPEFIAGALPTVLNELKGMRTGTSMMTSYQTLLGATTLRNQQIEMFQRLGIMDMTKAKKDHGHWNIAPGAIKGSELGMSDPYRWTQEILKPAFESQGITDIGKQREWMAKIFPNRNANRMFDIFLDPASVTRIEKDRQIYRGAMGLNEAYGEYTTQNPKGVEEAFHAQYKSMMGAIGAPLMQAALPVMIGITTMFNNIGAFAAAHPTAIKIIGEGFAAIGVVLIGAGGLAILAALGPVGWIAAGLAALGIVVANAKAMWEWLFGISKETTGAGTVPGANDSPGGAAFDRPTGPYTRRRGSVEPPPSGAAGDKVGAVYMDGRKVGAIVTGHQVASASGPSQGSAMFDPTMASMPVDYSFARG